MAQEHGKRLLFLSGADLSRTPHHDYCLPALVRDGWHVTVAAVNAESGVGRKTMPYESQVSDLRSRSGPARLFQEWDAAKALLRGRFGRYDVIYVHDQNLGARAAFLLSGPLFGKRIVYHSSNCYCPFRYPIYSRLERRITRMADLYISTEYHRAYMCRDRFRLKCPIVVVPPNLPEDWPIPARSGKRRAHMCGGKGEPQFVLMLPGGYVEARMAKELLQALAMLPRRFRLVMMGDPERGAERDAALEELHLADRVLCLPGHGFNEMLQYTVNADAGVLFYRNDDFGNFFASPGRFTEYLACGLPLLATNHTGLEALVLRYDLGECVDSTRPERIAEGIRRLEKSVREGRYSRRRMRRVFREHFAFDHWEPTVVAAFNDLIGPRRRRSAAPPSFPWLPSP